MDSEGRESLLKEAAGFVPNRWRLFVGASVGVLIPCYWHRHLEAGDLGSHVYNAWLAERAARGELPGVWIARQWNNVGFDLLLSGLAKVFPLMVAEKIAVSICVLTFFWGVFALISAASGRAPVVLMPLIAMVSYGWTFSDGFLNNYLSIGLSFFSLALLWKGKGWERWVVLLLVPLVWLAHPAGLVWLVGAGAYLLAAEALPQRYHVLLFLAAAAVLLGAEAYVRRHFIVYRARHAPYLYNGIDQLDLFTGAYKALAIGLLLFIAAVLAMEFAKRWNDHAIRTAASILLQVYVLVEIAVFLLPSAVRLPQYGAPFVFLMERLTCISIVLICCLLGLLRPRIWQLVAFGAAAVVFFGLLYRDTDVLNKMEDQAQALMETLPPEQRVLFTITNRGSRVLIGHFVDRACIGRCFSYGNYEPSTGQFRLRATPGNSFVMADFSAAEKMEDGLYQVQASDLPAYQIYQCSANGRELCIRPLEAGEGNNRTGSFRDSPFDLR